MGFDFKKAKEVYETLEDKADALYSKILEETQSENPSEDDGLFLEMEKHPDWNTYQSLSFDAKKYIDSIASIPGSDEHLQCWMVSVWGTPAPDATDPALVIEQEDIQDPTEVMDSQKFSEILGKIAGSFFTEVRSFIESNGYNITESGGGSIGWDLGIPCDHQKSDALCKLLHEQYTDEIEYGLIKITKEFYGWRWKSDEI